MKRNLVQAYYLLGRYLAVSYLNNMILEQLNEA